jgi:hypothetical protein
LGTRVGDVTALGDGFTSALAIELPSCRERERERERGKIKQIEKVLEFLEQIHVFFKSKETEAIFFFSAKERELKNYYIISP